MKMKLSLIVLLIFPLYKIEVECKNSRIIGGVPANAGQFRFMAAINVQTDTSRFFCGGALISNDWILTSGFCVDGATLFTIQLGSILLEGQDSERLVLATSEYVLHPEFDRENIQNDIALIKLREPITFTSYIDVIWLPFVTLKTNPVSAVGWGQTSDSEAGLSNTLQYVRGNVMVSGQCRIYYGTVITDKMTCFESNYNEGTCTGDIGGPLVESLGIMNWVVGVASFLSSNGCESIEPSGYTKVFEYNDWIFNVTGVEPV